MFQIKVVDKNQNTHFMFNNFFFLDRAVYQMMWKNIIELGTPQMSMWRMRIACWIPKATNTHSEYVIPIAFPLQQWLHGRASTLCCTYIVCLLLNELSSPGQQSQHCCTLSVGSPRTGWSCVLISKIKTLEF